MSMTTTDATSAAEGRPDGVVRLTLGDAVGASLDRARVDALDASLAAATRADSAVVLLGTDGRFCEGLDLATAAADAAAVRSGLRRFAALLDRLDALDVPVIAVVEGPALGGGLGLAAIADVVIAGPRARFGLPEALVGLIPAVVFPLLVRRVGPAVARRLALGVAPVDASEALRLGLADQVAEDPRAALRRQLARLARMDRGAIATVKALARTHWADPPGYRVDAVDRFEALLGGASAQARLSAMAAGEPPWEAAS